MNRPLPAFSACGVELEYAIVDRNTLSVAPIADELLHRLSHSSTSAILHGVLGWSDELVLHQVELKNIDPHPSIESLLPAFQAEIRHANLILESMGAKLMPTAMHPWMKPRTETRLRTGSESAIYQMYDRIFGCKSHRWTNLQSMHLNLPFGNSQQFERLHAAIRILLPILPALAASSPIVEGHCSGFLDSRMKNYCSRQMKLPTTMGMVIPETVATGGSYQNEIMMRMYREAAAHDPEGALLHQWLNVLGVIPRFDRDVLEIRVIDTQECLQADLAIATAVTDIVSAFYNEVYATIEEQQAVETDALAGVMQACIRDGELAIIDDRDYLRIMGFPGRHCEARELWRNLIISMHEDPLGPAQKSTGKILDTILKQGPLARRILRALGPDWHEVQLRAVYEELCACLEEGRMFLGMGETWHEQTGRQPRQYLPLH